MGSIPTFSTLKMKELRELNLVTLFFLPEFSQQMGEKRGKTI